VVSQRLVHGQHHRQTGLPEILLVKLTHSVNLQVNGLMLYTLSMAVKVYVAKRRSQGHKIVLEDFRGQGQDSKATSLVWPTTPTGVAEVETTSGSFSCYGCPL